jgi:hypothetical protein
MCRNCRVPHTSILMCGHLPKDDRILQLRPSLRKSSFYSKVTGLLILPGVSFPPMNQPDLQSTETYYFSVAHYHPIPLLIFLLVAALIVIIPYWKIFGKAGFPRIFGLFMIIPLVNLILLYVLAFSQWRIFPSQTENR